MSQTTYRAAIIGLGFIGGADQVSGDRLGQQVTNLDGTHFQALTRHPRIKLVAGSSRDDGRRERFEQRAAVPTFADWKQMLDTERFDIVSVASYAPSHAELVEACAHSGVRAIFCEKPIATRLSDAERMVHACQQSGSLLVINHNRRFHPHYHELSRRIAAGEIGDLTGGWLTWPTGRLGNVGTHFIDAALLLTGRRVTRVSATLDLAGRPDCRGPEFRDPGGWAMLQLDNGAIIHLHAPDYSNSPIEVVLHGNLGSVKLSRNTAAIKPWNGEPEELLPIPADDGTSMDRAVNAIVNWLDSGTKNECTAEAALQTLEIILACHASHAGNGAWTELPLTGADRDVEVHSG